MIIFFKMEAVGNDFILIDCMNERIQYNYSVLTRYLCDRKYGVGADGVIYVFKSSIANAKMRIFNKDGSEAEMCGNGIRCLAKYLYDKKIIEKKNMQIETLAGIKEINFKEDNLNQLIEVNMGRVNFEKYNSQIFLPREFYKSKIEDFVIEYNGIKRKYNFVSLGNPHVVSFVENFEELDFENTGKYVEKYKFFPQNTNVEFCNIIDRNNISVKVWERGVGRTLGCGTGAVAVSSVAIKKGFVENKVNIHLEGGKVEVIKKGEMYYLSGNANFVFEGKIKEL